MPTKRTDASRERASKREAASLIDVVVGDVSLAQQFGRIGGNITPGRISQILQRADSGHPSDLVDLVHEFRQKDGHLHSIAQAREVCVASLPFDIVPPGEEQLKRDKKIARQCRLALQHCETFNVAKSHLIGEGLFFGHSTVEVVWKVEEEGELAGLMVPDRFEPVSCRRFGFRQSDGALLFDPTGFGSFESEGIDLIAENPPGKFLHARPRVTGDVLAREGLARIVAWMCGFRNFDIRDWLMLAEMGWKPKRTGKYKKDASKQDKAALLTILERLTSAGVAIYPETVELELHWPTNFSRQSNHKELADFLARELSKAWLGTSDTSEQNSENGARSAVEKRDELRKDLRDWDAAWLGLLLTKQLVRSFYRLNYGERIEPGAYVPLVEDPTNVKEFAEAMSKLSSAGLEIPQSWVRAKVGSPEPKKGEPVLAPATPPSSPTKPDGDPKDDDKPAGQGDEKPDDEAA